MDVSNNFAVPIIDSHQKFQEGKNTAMVAMRHGLIYLQFKIKIIKIINKKGGFNEE